MTAIRAFALFLASVAAVACRAGDPEAPATRTGGRDDVAIERAWRTRHPQAQLESMRPATAEDDALGGAVVALMQQGRAFELVYDRDARLVAVREPVGPEGVPAAVAAAVRANRPNARIVRAQREIRDPHGASVELIRVEVEDGRRTNWERYLVGGARYAPGER